jgi:formylglycine-generating enzyme required for sulfatase activity
MQNAAVIHALPPTPRTPEVPVESDFVEEYRLPETWANARDGSLLQLIPAGEFIMGSTPAEIDAAREMDRDGPLFALRHETPQFRVFAPAFYLGVFAVTNAQFVRFLNEVRPESTQLKRWLPTAAHILPPSGAADSYRVEPDYERYPVVDVSWFGAEAYCQWAGLRLPREIEWEKGARGTDGRIFPWGNDWDENRLCWYGGRRGEHETTAPVDAFPEGRSPYGLFQMAGNVDEWCADPYQPDVYARYATGDLHVPPNGYGRVVRGGTCLRKSKLEFRCAMRRGSAEAFVNILHTGLRCASSKLQWTKVRHGVHPVAATAKVHGAPSPSTSPPSP